MNINQLQLEIQYWIQDFDVKQYRITPLVFNCETRAFLVQFGIDVQRRKRGLLINRTDSSFDIRRMIEDYYVAYDIESNLV